VPIRNSASALQAAVFLDRDGTVNEERNYLVRAEDFVFIPGVPEAIARLNRAGFFVVLVTNQSGIARGYFSRAEVDVLHRYLQRELQKQGARIDAIYLCPHHPDYSVERLCSCRKGAPGMLLQAAAEHSIDLGASYMIGDKPADLEAGRRAGCKPLLVRTGYGRQTEAGLKEPVEIFDDLPAAIQTIISLAAGAETSCSGEKESR